MVAASSATLRRGVLPGERAVESVAGAAPFLLGALLSGLLAGDQGGYWPTSWGWATLALVWLAGIALVLRRARIGRLELLWVGGLLALTAWTGLSWLWTGSRTQTALEVERTLVYLAAAVAVVAAVRSASYRSLLWGVWAGSTAACLYGLATRLLPDRLGVSDPLAGARLSAPVGYWNGLGLLAATAAILAIGLAVHGQPRIAAAAAAASLPLLMATLYFTFSRGAWVALAASLAAATALSRDRLRLLSAVLVAAAPVAAALWLAYRASALRLTDAPLAQAVHAGHTLAWQLLPVSLVAAALGFLLAGRRLRLTAGARRGVMVLLAAAAAAGCVAFVAHHRGATGGGRDVSSRLFSLSSSGRMHQWQVALDEWRAHPLLGSGAGTFGQYWAAAGPDQNQLLDAHNLYLETLAELGPVGLLLLCGALLAPLGAAVRARNRPLVPIAAGAYVAWLVHVAYDWDWELAGVTVGALLCAGAILAADRRRLPPLGSTTSRRALAAIVLVSGALSLIGLLGNRALAQSGQALSRGDASSAVAAAEDARRWAPWSAQPWQQLAAIRIVQGDLAGARAAYRHAVAKDPRNWELWLGLESVSSGAERARALARLASLNPGAASGAITGAP